MKPSSDGAGPSPVPALRGLAPYTPARHPAPVDLVLSGNEGDRPPASLLQGLAGRETEVLRRYPDASSLERVLAARLRIAPERVVVTAGGDEAIDRLCRAFLGPGRHLVLPQPTFVMFAHYARLAGAVLDAVPWPDGPYPIDAVLAAVTERTAMITLVSPNNPTGAVACASDVRRLAAAAPHALLVVDQAYAEYADEDLTDIALAFPNAVVVRTISKAWGLAGLRVGYAAGAATLIGAVRLAGGPYPVSGLSVALAEQALATREESQRAHVAAVRRERQRLGALLRELGWDAPPSQGNFVQGRGPDAAWLRDGLAGLGIAVRLFAEDPALAGCVRITCPGDEPAFERLCGALRTVLRPQALLFDMDGVLADVSGSYRRAIAETAASFGVHVTMDDISSVKAQGNANNDWHLTHRLIERGGGQATLDEVTRRFEDLYQGTPGRPGLYRSETVLPDRAVLERLAARLPLAVVTGRPRRDAERWLRDHDLAASFQAVVCLEDGPLKPDPAIVTLALRRLGVERAWLVGDTPDDMRSARAAGVVPLGLPAPSDRGARTVEALFSAGAARVLDGFADLEGMLP